MKVVVILTSCALVIVALTYYGAGAYLRDRERQRRRDGDPTG
ncbi:MAG TPA: hypothetical protein VMZ00_01505 [Sporichthya sp.]|nr:hypothetical protein [Sporichthya sp.]